MVVTKDGRPWHDHGPDYPATLRAGQTIEVFGTNACEHTQYEADGTNVASLQECLNNSGDDLTKRINAVEFTRDDIAAIPWVRLHRCRLVGKYTP